MLSIYVNLCTHFAELPMPIYADNLGAKTVATDTKFRARMKHIAVPYQYQRQAIEDGTVKLVYTLTNEMAADGLTKPLNGQNFKKFKRLLGMSEDVTPNRTSDVRLQLSRKVSLRLAWECHWLPQALPEASPGVRLRKAAYALRRSARNG
jgi:hypothetical protein